MSHIPFDIPSQKVDIDTQVSGYQLITEEECFPAIFVFLNLMSTQVNKHLSYNTVHNNQITNTRLTQREAGGMS